MPDICITSYLGRPEVREKRLGFHLRQRRQLKTDFPDLKILSFCSNYSTEEKALLEKEGFDAFHSEDRLQKWQKQNLTLKVLFRRKQPLQAVLFLDDDVVPRTWQPDDVANGLLD